MSAPTWDVAQKEKLRELVAERQLSCAEIGRVIGKTKNAVVGMMRRMKISNAKYSTGFAEPPSTTQPTPKQKKPRFKPYQSPPLPFMDLSECVHLFDVAHNQCRWSHEDNKFMCCGKPVLKGYSYCVTHKEIAYVPFKPKKETL